MLRLLEAQASPAWASLVAVIVVVVDVTAMVFAAPLALRREVLDEAGLGEVVLVGVMKLAPLATVSAGGAGFLYPPAGFPLGGGFERPSAAKIATAFRLFALAPGFGPSRAEGSSGVPRCSTQAYA